LKCQPNLLIPPKKKKKSSPKKKSFLLAKKSSSPAKETSSLAKTASIAARPPELLLTLSVSRLFSPEKPKTPALGLPVKSLVKAQVPKKAPVPKKAAVRQGNKGQAIGVADGQPTDQTASQSRGTAKAAQGQAKRPGKEAAAATAALTEGTAKAEGQGGTRQVEAEQAIHTRSGRRPVKRVIFEAGKN